MRLLIPLFLILLAGSLVASEIDENQCPHEILELLSLPEDQQNEKLYTRESIKWGDFSFTYVYPNPTMNALIAEWTEGRGIRSQPDPIDPKHQYYNFSSHPQDIQR